MFMVEMKSWVFRALIFELFSVAAGARCRGRWRHLLGSFRRRVQGKRPSFLANRRRSHLLPKKRLLMHRTVMSIQKPRILLFMNGRSQFIHLRQRQIPIVCPISYDWKQRFVCEFRTKFPDKFVVFPLEAAHVLRVMDRFEKLLEFREFSSRRFRVNAGAYVSS